MPYSINPPCSSGSITEITFRVKGESGSIIKTNGDDYRIITEYASQQQYEIRCSWIPKDFQRCIVGNYTATGSWQFYGALTGETEISYHEPPFASCRVINTVYLRREGDGSDRQTWLRIGSNSYDSQLRYTVRGMEVGSFSLDAYYPIGQPVRNFSKHTAEIYKNGQLIESFSRSSSSATISATWRCIGGCPPNTCEVICGDTICCYNSEGISVFNYPRT